MHSRTFFLLWEQATSKIAFNSEWLAVIKERRNEDCSFLSLSLQMHFLTCIICLRPPQRLGTPSLYLSLSPYLLCLYHCSSKPIRHDAKRSEKKGQGRKSLFAFFLKEILHEKNEIEKEKGKKRRGRRFKEKKKLETGEKREKEWKWKSRTETI